MAAAEQQPQQLPIGLENAAQQPYIAELLSYPLDRLHKEPELLRLDAERITRQMQELAVGNYQVFIAAAESLKAITAEVASIDSHLENSTRELPKLTAGCNEFMESAQQILEKRKLNATLLANQSTMLDLLEIPQLMDTCVRNGNYDEALDLEAFVAKLATMHMRLPVIQYLVAGVRQTTQFLLSQLLQRLRSNVQLPECLRIIGYLRRLGVYNDQELRLQFLRCRESWLSGLLDDLDQTSPYEHLKKMADCHRVHLFDVVTQYRAIFSDDTSGMEETVDGGLLFSWAMHRITCFLDALQELLPKVSEGTSLAIILDQCMYCGMSLGRVGLDFRGLLPSAFETCIRNLFIRNMSTALENFKHMLETHRWVPLPTVKIGSKDEGSDAYAPSASLMEHPPVAVFVNGVLTALNELRHCAPVNLSGILASELKKTLETVSELLLQYNTTRLWKGGENTLFISLCRAFLEVALPYCILCFTRCYPHAFIDSKEIGDSLRKQVAEPSTLTRGNGLGIVRSIPPVVENIITNLEVSGLEAERTEAQVS